MSVMLGVILAITGMETALFDRVGEFFNQIEGLAHMVAGAFDAHVGAGKVEFQHVRPVVFRGLGKIGPLIVGKTHDAGDQHVLRDSSSSGRENRAGCASGAGLISAPRSEVRPARLWP